MQGVILDEMRQFIAQQYGYRAWLETVKRAGRGAFERYELHETYPDEELAVLARTAAEVTGTPPLDLLCDFGRSIVPDMMRVYSYLIDARWGYADFLLHMEPLLQDALQVHNPGATQAKVHATNPSPGVVRVVYDSPLRACSAVEGVIRGAAREYGARIELVQQECVLRGAPACVFDVTIVDEPGRRSDGAQRPA